MSSCPSLVAQPDGFCGSCGRRWARYGDRLEHRRGRHVGSPAVMPLTGMELHRRKLALLAMPWDELVRLDLCECGQRLSTHPALPKVGPLLAKASEGRRVIAPEAQARLDAARLPAQQIWGSQPFGASTR